MTVRPIDGNALKEALAEAIKDAPLYIQATVDQYIEEAPTLILLNERAICSEDVEKVWRAHWHNWGDGVSCSFCDTERPMKTRNLNYPSKLMQFCPRCGGAMTDEAVEMVMERLEALHDKNV